MENRNKSNRQPVHLSKVLNEITANLRAQGLQLGRIIDLTGQDSDEETLSQDVRTWRVTGPKGLLVIDGSIRRSEVLSADGTVQTESLVGALGHPGQTEDLHVVLIPPARVDTPGLIGFHRAGLSAFAVVARNHLAAKDWVQILRYAFDAGYISVAGLRSASVAAPQQLTFLRSDLVRDANRIGALDRGVVAMSTLGNNGRFANQLMQYAYVKLYALRHGLRCAVPQWIGADLYGRRDRDFDYQDLKELNFFAFDNDDLQLWRMQDPPANIDLRGYFQELPLCWQPHRALLRELFALSPALSDAITQRLAMITQGGRELVAIHVRRGDYKALHQQGLPWYRPVPEEWYIAWLRDLWPKLANPLLYVATDEPGAVLESFTEFKPVSAAAFTIPDLPAHVLDFEILRRAEHIAIANSSFSRMAAILAADTQACVCPDFETRSFLTYDAWADRDFWGRFEADPKANQFLGYGADARASRSVLLRTELGHWRREAEKLQAALKSKSPLYYRRELKRLKSKVGVLERYLAERSQALQAYEAAHSELGKTIRKQSRLNAEEIVRWQNWVSELQQLVAERTQTLNDYQVANLELRHVSGEQSRRDAEEIDHWKGRVRELEVQQQLTSETVARHAHAFDAASRMHTFADYLKLLLFWPLAWLIAQVARAYETRAPLFARKLEQLAEHIHKRHYRVFLSMVAKRICRTSMGVRATALAGTIGAMSSEMDVSLRASPIPAEGAIQEDYREQVSLSQPAAGRERARYALTHALRGPVVFLEGLTNEISTAVTLASLSVQTFSPSQVRNLGDSSVCDVDDLVCVVRSGVELDPTAMEMLASVLLSVPDCKYVVASGGSAKTGASPPIAACMMPALVWRDRHPSAVGLSTPLLSFEALRFALEDVWGNGVLLPIPLASWIETPALEIAAWSAILLSPEQWQLWPSGSPVDAASQLTTFIGNRTPVDKDEARPHLLVVVPWLPIGGSEVVLLDLLERMVQTWRISICTTLPGNHEMRGVFRGLTNEIYHAGDIFEPLRLQAFISGLILARNTAVVLSSNCGLLYRIVPELKAVHPTVAFVDLLHNDQPAGHICGALEASTSLDRHVAVSRRVGEALVLRGVPRDRVVVVPNGVDTELFNPNIIERSFALQSLGLTDETLVLAFVGRFSVEKRVLVFADIVKQVSKTLHVQAIAVGEGPQDKTLRDRIAGEGLPIRIIPKMSRSQLTKIYAAADLLILTSLVEGMPMVVLEAMATGCPVAMTDVGDVRRIIESGENGFLAPTDSPELLVDQIITATLEPTLLNGMRVKARAAITSSGMTKAAMQDRYAHLFQCLLTEKPSEDRRRSISQKATGTNAEYTIDTRSSAYRAF